MRFLDVRRAIVTSAALLLGWSFVWGCAREDIRLADSRDGGDEGASPPAFTEPVDAFVPPREITGLCIETECPKPYTTCPWDQTKCATNLATDAVHCGTCGHECADLGPQMLSRCVNGTCEPECLVTTVGVIEEYRDCNGVRVDGCEINITSDRDNCGACGKKCPQGDRCANGLCGGCPAGATDCDGQCVFTSSDYNNCGACGHVCDLTPDAAAPPPNMMYGCENSQCEKLQCIGGWADCNGLIGDGCEVDVRGGDPKNCGACGNACAANQICRDVASKGLKCICAASETLCGDPASTEIWCANLLGDPRNCGACGYHCPGTDGFDLPTGWSPVCLRGLCGYTCLPGYGDCDGQSQNGCETNLAKNPLHCGGCGKQCDIAGGQPCVEGACLTTACDASVPK